MADMLGRDGSRTRTWRRDAVAVVVAVTVLGSSPALFAHVEAENSRVDFSLADAILGALTPEQAERFLAGADPAEITLEDGRSLDEVIAVHAIDSTTGSAYHPLPNCIVVRTAISALGKFAAGEVRKFLLRGPTTDLSAQGGSATGCGVAADATAAVLNLRVRTRVGAGEAYVAAVGDHRFHPVVRFSGKAPAHNMVTLPLGATGEWRMKLDHPGNVVAHVVGYFSPLAGATGLGSTPIFHDDFDPPLSPIWEIKRADAWVDNGWLHTRGGPVGPHRDAVLFLGEGEAWTDYRLSTRFYAEGGGNKWYNAYIFFRVQEWIPANQGGTFYSLHIKTPLWPTGASLFLYRVVDDIGTSLLDTDVPSGAINDRDNTVSVEVLGGRIRVYINGRKLIDYLDSAPILSGGVGLGSIWESHTRFDFVHLEH